MQTTIVDKGRRAFVEVWQEMREFTQQRSRTSADQIWLLEHDPVYTRGAGCRDLPANNPHDIPVVHCDRGGQMTYHAPGQLIVYLLLDMKRMKLGPKSLIGRIEEWIINVLGEWHVPAVRRHRAPGVYVGEAKIGAMGLRISSGCCYHGFAVNIDMDLAPFDDIDPCGFAGLEVTQVSHFNQQVDVVAAKEKFTGYLRNIL